MFAAVFLLATAFAEAETAVVVAAAFTSCIERTVSLAREREKKIFEREDEEVKLHLLSLDRCAGRSLYARCRLCRSRDCRSRCSRFYEV